MKFRKIEILICYILFIFCVCCEYKLKDENLKQINPPGDVIMYDLNLKSGKDTISIFNTTDLTYEITLPYGVSIKEAHFSLNEINWDAHTGKGTFRIQPKDFPIGYDTLFLYITTNSGTGSIADLSGYEKYFIKKYWITVIDQRVAPALTPIKGVSEEGFLKITWPRCDQYNFQSYEIVGTVGDIQRKKIIRCRDSAFYIEPCFIGGTAYFQVNTRVYTGNVLTIGNSVSFSDSYPTLKFEEKGLDSLKISWNKSKYKANYRLDKGTYMLLYMSVDTSCTILCPELGTSSSFILYTSPSAEYATSSSYTKTDSKTYTLGQFLNIYNRPFLAYNYYDKAVYTNRYNYLVRFDISDLSLKSTFAIPNLLYENTVSCQIDSHKVATLSPDTLYIFPDKILQMPVKIPFYTPSLVDHFQLTENDIIAVAYDKKYKQYSIKDNKVIADIDISDYPYYSKWSSISTSKDGKYVCIVTRNGALLYNLENGVITKKYSDNRIYRSVLFDINDPHQVLLTFNNNNILEIRNAEDFSLRNSIELPTVSEVIRNIEPESGYMLLTDYTNIYIMDLHNSKMVLKMRCSNTKPYFFGKRIFTDNGYTLDISRFLQ